MATAPDEIAPEKLNPWGSLWRALIKFESGKVQPAIALRNAVGITLPLAISVAVGHPEAGTVAAMGAMHVAFTDGSDPYLRRAGRMLAAAVIGSIPVFVGRLCGGSDIITVSLIAAWGFAAGMMVALEQDAADIGLISFVTFVVFASYSVTLEQAAYSGLLALCGGLVQLTLSLALWPIRRDEPERRAMAELYGELSRLASGSFNAMLAPPASAEFSHAHQVLSGGFRRSAQSDRYRSLLNQAERIRLSLLVIARLRARLQREPETGPDTEVLARCREISARILLDIASAFSSGGKSLISPEPLQQLRHLANAYRETSRESIAENTSALVKDARFHVDAIEGQLRAAIDLAMSSTPEGRAVFERRQASTPWMLRILGRAATLRANLSLRSAVFRHAIRLSLCVGFAEALGRLLDWERSYWLPMTVAIILKPDFSTTMSRGVLRLAGTFVGLLCATALFHLLPLGPAVEVAFIGILAFILRCFGPANYGIFVVAISALVVLLFALTGVMPNEVVASRALNTVVGGVLALTAYALWPTWERTQVSELMARMLEAYREYFRTVRDAYTNPDDPKMRSLESIRLRGRLARSNLEASVERLRGEPLVKQATVELMDAMLASSHRLVHAMMSLEAGLSRSHPVPARPQFHTFASHVETTLHSLAAMLRGSPLRREDLPDIRADHHALIDAGDALEERYALTNVESDRITNSLNTLSAQLFQWKK